MSGYKETAVGRIPVEWEYLEFGDVLELIIDNRGKTPPVAEGLTEYPLLEVNSITKNNPFPKYDVVSKYVTKGTYDTWFRSGHPVKGDILIPTVGSLGDAVVLQETKGSIAQNIVALRMKTSQNSMFWYHYISSAFFANQIMKVQMNAVQPSLRVPHMKKFIVPLPPLPEQQKIAEILTTVDEKITVVDEEITAVITLKTGLMQKLFSEGIGHSAFKDSPVGRIPVEWEVRKFDDVVNIVNGQVDPTVEPYADMPHIGPANMDKRTGFLLAYNTAREDKQISGKYLFDEYHVLYGKINPQFGKVVFPKFVGVCSADTYPIEAKKEFLIPSFLKYLLLEDRFYRYTVSVSQRTGMPKVNREELSSFAFVIPPLPEQQKIAEILTTVDDKLSVLQEKKASFTELKKGLMQKLLTGEIRVKTEVA